MLIVPLVQDYLLQLLLSFLHLKIPVNVLASPELPLTPHLIESIWGFMIYKENVYCIITCQVLEIVTKDNINK